MRKPSVIYSETEMPIKKPFAYSLSLWGLILYYLSLAVVLVLLLLRTNTAFWEILPAINGYSLQLHISNFSISYILLTGSGLAQLYQKDAWRYIYTSAAILLLCNIVIEEFVPIINTPDLLDAFAGFWGIIGALLALWGIEKYFSKPKPTV
jgi:ABC-type transport system involved in cytochrome c biogenesis permease subunit